MKATFTVGMAVLFQNEKANRRLAGPAVITRPGDQDDPGWWVIEWHSINGPLATATVHQSDLRPAYPSAEKVVAETPELQ